MWMLITSAVENSSCLSTARTPCGSARAWVRFGDHAITVIPNAWARVATGTPRRPSPTIPSVEPDRPGPIVCCQPPARTAASSWAKLRVSAIIMPIVNSGIALPEPPAPQTSDSLARRGVEIDRGVGHPGRDQQPQGRQLGEHVCGERRALTHRHDDLALREPSHERRLVGDVVGDHLDGVRRLHSGPVGARERHRLVVVQHRHGRHLRLLAVTKFARPPARRWLRTRGR